MRYNENSCIHKRRIETVELHKVTNRKLLMQHRLWTPDVFSHSTWFHHFSPTERLLSQLHHQTLTFPRRAEIFTVWRASLLPTFNHRSRQKRRREDKYSSSFWLTLFSLPVSHQHVLCFSLVSCLTDAGRQPASKCRCPEQHPSSWTSGGFGHGRTGQPPRAACLFHNVWGGTTA